MEIKINDSTRKELEELAVLKNISIEQAATIVLENYTSRNIVRLKQAHKAAENAINRYGR